MIVQFAVGQIRISCTPHEREALARGRSVKLEVPLPGRHRVVVSVDASVLGTWRLDSDPTGIWLSVPQSEIVGVATETPATIRHEFAVESGARASVCLEFTRPE